MPDTNEQSDDFDDMLRELKDNWDLISSQLMSDQLPTTSFAMSSLDDFQSLLAESTGKMERLLHKKQKTAYEISACLVGSEMCIRDSRRSSDRAGICAVGVVAE